jgi:hypothetical protein
LSLHLTTLRSNNTIYLIHARQPPTSSTSSAIWLSAYCPIAAVLTRRIQHVTTTTTEWRACHAKVRDVSYSLRFSFSLMDRIVCVSHGNSSLFAHAAASARAHVSRLFALLLSASDPHIFSSVQVSIEMFRPGHASIVRSCCRPRLASELALAYPGRKTVGLKIGQPTASHAAFNRLARNSSSAWTTAFPNVLALRQSIFLAPFHTTSALALHCFVSS